MTNPSSVPSVYCLIVFLSSLTLYNSSSFFHTIGPTDLLHPSPAPHFKKFQEFLIYFPKRPSFSTIQNCAPYVALYWFLPYILSHFCLLKAAFSMAILDSISRLYTSCIICHHATQTLELLHIVHFILIGHN